MEEKMVKVRNRNIGSTVYVIPDLGVNRKWNVPGEVKDISLKELQALQWVKGGDYILKHLLVVEDKSALEYLNMEVEPEYHYTEADIKKLLMEGSLDQFEDFLNFSPEGGLNLAKDMAIEMKLPDTRKRKMLSEKIGFNIDSAIRLQEEFDYADANKTEEAPVTKTRKAAPINADKVEEKPVRKSLPKYNVVE